MSRYVIGACATLLIAVGLWSALADRPDALPAPALDGAVVLASADAALAPSGAILPRLAAPLVAAKLPASCANEEQKLSEMKRELERNPGQALNLSRSCEGKFHDAAREAERAAVAIQALVSIGKIGQARAEAETFVKRYPTGDLTMRIENLTGIHSHQRRVIH